MFDVLVSILISGVAVFLVAQFLPGFRVKDFTTALVVAVLVAVFNFVISFFMLLLLPFRLLTLGLLDLIVSALLLWIASRIVSGFQVDGVLNVLIGAFLIALIKFVIRLLLPGI